MIVGFGVPSPSLLEKYVNNCVNDNVVNIHMWMLATVVLCSQRSVRSIQHGCQSVDIYRSSRYIYCGVFFIH